MYDVQNKTVMIIGAASGDNAKSAVFDLPTSNGQNKIIILENEFRKSRAVFFACDVTKTDDLKEMTFKKIVDAFKLDIFINNMIDLNVKALIRGSMLAFDYMVLAVIGNANDEAKKYLIQTIDNVILAILDLIRKGKNGAV
ncbi:PGDH dehydrogenase, partial [Acromyrmex insinuator]